VGVDRAGPVRAPMAELADGALDAPQAVPEQQTELGARLQELVRQAEAQAQQVRREIARTFA